jgi:hypothetical protein
MGAPEGKVPLARPRRGWKGNVKMYLEETGWEDVWINLAEDWNVCRPIVNTVNTFGFHKMPDQLRNCQLLKDCCMEFIYSTWRMAREHRAGQDLCGGRHAGCLPAAVRWITHMSCKLLT